MNRTDRLFLAPATVLVAIQLVFGTLLGIAGGYSFSPDLVRQLSIAAVFVFPIFAGHFLFFLLRCIYRRAESPLAQLREDYRNHRWRVATTAWIILLIVLQVGLLNYSKSMIPMVTTYWADPLLAAADRLLFLGADPWTLFHQIDVPFIDRIYAIWAPLMFGTILVLPFLKASKTRSIALLSWFLVFAIDIMILQFTLPSGGPIFYERLGHGSEFAGIPLHPVASQASDYLWTAYVARDSALGGGISAFPSMHVATSFWMALVWRSYSKPLGLAGFVFSGLILFGSVYLGWHYLWDGIVSIALAFACFRIAETLLSARYNRYPMRSEPRPS